MIRLITIISLIVTAITTSAASPTLYTNDVKKLTYILLHGTQSNLTSYAKKGNLSTDELVSKIIEIGEAAFDTDCTPPQHSETHRLCRRVIEIAGNFYATNSLPFLEKIVMNGSPDLCYKAFYEYGKISRRSGAFIDLGERAANNSFLTLNDYITELQLTYYYSHQGRDCISPEDQLKIAVRTCLKEVRKRKGSTPVGVAKRGQDGVCPRLTRTSWGNY